MSLDRGRLEVKDKKTKIGILGGTFNPIHVGHLRAAEEVCEALSLEKILFIPSGIPPHREEDLAPFDHRYQMVKLATEGNPHFAVLDIEGRRPGMSYTVDTLKELNRLYPLAKLYFILGLDAFLEIETWRSYKKLFSLAHFVIISRPGFDETHIGDVLKKIFKDIKYDKEGMTFYIPGALDVLYRKITLLDISATLIRNLIKKGLSIRYLVPESVEQYIYEKGVYGKYEIGSQLKGGYK